MKISILTAPVQVSDVFVNTFKCNEKSSQYGSPWMLNQGLEAPDIIRWGKIKINKRKSDLR